MDELKIAIIGCGQISEAHLKELRYINCARVVGVCDLYELLAKDLAERFKVQNYYDDYQIMIQTLKPDVVHILTPPHTHFCIGKYSLENKCHIYIEKPICLNYNETEELINIAKENNVLICPGFMQFEDMASQRFIKYLENDKLGEIIHIDSFYGNSLDDNFSKLFIKTKDHWIHDLPGKLFQNIISHAIYHLLPLLKEDIEDVKCYSFDRSKNNVFHDELRVMFKSGYTTAYLTFSSSIKPIRQYIRVFGSKSTVELDFANHKFTKLEETELPGPLGRVRNCFIPGINEILQGIINSYNFFFGKDRYFLGMYRLFVKFYDCIKNGKMIPPIRYEIVRKEAYLMEQISKKSQQ